MIFAYVQLRPETYTQPLFELFRAISSKFAADISLLFLTNRTVLLVSAKLIVYQHVYTALYLVR